MKAVPASAVRCYLSLIAPALLATGALGADPPAPVNPVSSAAPPKVEVPVKPAPKKLAFEMRDKPWSQVLEWLSDQTGMLVIASDAKPTGTLTFIAPKENGAAKQFTVPEIIDSLNDELLKQNYILIRRSNSFTLATADKKIDPSQVARVRGEDLDQFGNTEMVSVVIGLKSLVAEDVAGEIKKMMGPFGEVVALTQANQLLLQDTVGNLKRIQKTLHDIEDNSKGEMESYPYECKFIKARDAERILREQLGDPNEQAKAMQPQQPGFPGFPGFPQPQRPVGPTPKIRMHYITAAEQLNKVIVTGPANIIARAKAVLKEIDVGQKGQPPRLIGEAVFKTYQVAGGNAEAIAKALGEIYKSSPTLRISAINNNAIIVYACPDDQIDIEKHIHGSTDKGIKTELIAVTSGEPAKVAETLTKMFGDAKGGAPFIEASADLNAIVVRGTPDQVTDVKATVQAMGQSGGPTALGGNMRVITLEKGSAATLAEALERILPQMRKNPVRVVIPGAENERKPEPAPIPDKSREQQPDKQSRNHLDSETLIVRQLVDPKDVKEDKKAKPAAPPVTITAFGNKLLVSSDDPQAMQLVQELVKLLTQTPGGEGDFQVIRLQNAMAIDAAKVLDEAFNGSKQQAAPQQGGGRGGFFGQFGAPGAQPPSNPRQDRIRVVADPATNSLLVRASPLDMMTIRRLLDRAVDTGENKSKGAIATHVIGPLKHAIATEVASVITSVYREHIDINAQTEGRGGFLSRFAPQQNQNIGPDGQPRPVTLSVGTDDRTNSLVVACSAAMYEDIKKLVDQLELAAKDSTRTVKVVPIKGIDPALVQQAIEAIQGRTTNSRENNNTPGTMPIGGLRPFGGGNGFSPGGGGNGFRPGGGGGGPGRGGQSRGPSFFEDRVMDDPQPSLLYDPRQVAVRANPNAIREPEGVPADRQVQTTGAEEQEQQPMPPAAGTNVLGPRSPVNAQALPELGVIVIEGQNPADVEAILEVIKLIQQLGAGAEIQVQLVPLRYGDATAITTTLNQLYQRVNVGASGNVAAPTPRTTTTQGVFGTTTQAQSSAASVVLIPQPRFNAILVAVPKARMQDVIKEITRLDQPTSPQGQAVPFALKKASAARVETLILNFYSQRYPGESVAQHQVRVTHDDSTNTLFVQAGPADLKEIGELIKLVDTTVSSAVNDLRIVPLRNVLADELATVLQKAITDAVATSSGDTTTAAPAPTTPPGQFPGAPGQAPGAPGQFPGAPGGQPVAIPGQVGRPATGGTTSGSTKTTSLRFISLRANGGRTIESGLLEDIHITSESRTNLLIISAPEKTMDLILALIKELDVPPSVQASINIFTLKKADALLMANMLSQLYLGTGGSTGQTGAPGGAPGGLPGGIPGGGAPGGMPTTGGTGQGAGSPGAGLIAPRITVDARTNSLLIVASPVELDMIDAIIQRLEDAEVQTRHNDVVQLKNASAADVANALTTFVANSINVVSLGGQLSPFAEFERQVVVVPEPITNKLLISATPRYYAEVMRLIAELDAEQAQVVIQVLVAEVDLTGTEEFGCEIGLQSPILFQRTVIPAFTFNNQQGPGNLLGPNGSVTYASATGGLVPPGVTVNNSVNPSALPGFNFNNTGPLGNNPVVGPGIVGYQGIGNLGVGRVSPTSNVGGFVFSAASDAFTLTIRALKTQGRLDVLSRPQVMTLDNQTANVNVGQLVPYVTSSTLTATGLSQSNVTQQQVGVVLNVTPRISPDGKVLMRVQPTVSSLSASTVSVGTGINLPIINTQELQTTVMAGDGETVVLGGLITKKDQKSENKIPWFGDLPGVGALFRYRTQDKEKRELIVVLTPHIVRSRMEADHILAEESRRMDWVLGDVVKVHGTTGLEPILPPPPAPGTAPVAGRTGNFLTPAVPPASVPCMPSPASVQPQGQPLAPQGLPMQPQAVPVQPQGEPLQQQTPASGPQASMTLPPVQAPTVLVPPAQPVMTTNTTSADQGKESRRWQLGFSRN